MKRIFISFLAVIAMVGMANAQRVWAYNLDLEESVEGLSMCKFTFVATANATTANLVFFNTDGVEEMIFDANQRPAPISPEFFPNVLLQSVSLIHRLKPFSLVN